MNEQLRVTVYVAMTALLLYGVITQPAVSAKLWAGEFIETLLTAAAAGLLAFLGPRIIKAIARDKVVDEATQLKEARDYWRRKTDEDVLEATRCLNEYTEAGKAAIREELERREIQNPVT